MAAVLDGGKCRLVELSSLAEVRQAVAGLRLALRAAQVIGAPSAAPLTLAEAGRTVQDLVLAPLGLPPSREMVIVADGPVLSTPWALLPHLAQAPLVVATSAGTLLRSPATSPPKLAEAKVVIVVGPGLRYGDEEADAINDEWGGHVSVLRGEHANVAGAATAMRGADVVHIAAHGIFRGDNPLLSSVRLSDGPITGDELARATTTARLVVLSCCDTGMADPSGLGLSRLLTGAGATSVIASVSPVPDAGSVELMTKLHGELVIGTSPVVALAAARQWLGGPFTSPTSAGFVCFGNGFGDVIAPGSGRALRSGATGLWPATDDPGGV
jgi:hypothetical protein